MKTTIKSYMLKCWKRSIGWSCHHCFFTDISKNFESVWFKINHYDKCVNNQTVRDSQQTVTWYVDDVKVSHQLSELNEEFCQWYEAQYRNDTYGHVKINKGKDHIYLGMILGFSIKIKCLLLWKVMS